MQVLTLVAVAIAAAGLVNWNILCRRQTNAQVFMEYSRRYEQIMSTFPQESRTTRFRFEGEPPQESDALSFAVLRYLNLCSEEYYLWKRNYLATEIWRIWEAELARTLKSPLIRREWKKLKEEFQAFPEFLAYVESVQAA
ncbi:MAG: hypothetical protein ACREI3_11960 [Nitrospirales bacterium]